MSGEDHAHVPRTGFVVSRRGYDQQQVDAHLRRLDAEVRMLVADRDAAVAQNTRLGRELDDARSRGEALHQQVNRLAGPPQSVQGMSERLRSMLRLAEDEVAEMHRRADVEIGEQRRAAEEHAQRIVGDARDEAERLEAVAEAHRAEMDELRRTTVQELAERRETAERELAEQRERIETDLRERQESGDRSIRDADSAAQAERTRLESESDSRRLRVEQDFAVAMDQRRQEALGALMAERATLSDGNARLRRDADAEAQRITSEAGDAARRTVRDAEQRAAEITEAARREVERLTGLRGEVTEQLRRARATIDGELGVAEDEVTDARIAPPEAADGTGIPGVENAVPEQEPRSAGEGSDTADGAARPSPGWDGQAASRRTARV